MVNREVEVGEVVGSDKQNSDTRSLKRSAYLVSKVLGAKTSDWGLVASLALTLVLPVSR